LLFVRVCGENRFMRCLLISVVVLFSATVQSSALGNSGCGSCDFPEEKAESARMLEEQIGSADHDHLRRLLFVAEVCAANGFDCGNLTEEEAGRLVEYHFEATRARWDAIQKVALGFVAFAGLGLGLANRYRPRA
jgi:hypothetical protein